MPRVLLTDLRTRAVAYGRLSVTYALCSHGVVTLSQYRQLFGEYGRIGHS